MQKQNKSLTTELDGLAIALQQPNYMNLTTKFLYFKFWKFLLFLINFSYSLKFLVNLVPWFFSWNRKLVSRSQTAYNSIYNIILSKLGQ